MLMPALIEDEDTEDPAHGSLGDAGIELVHGEGEEDGEQEEEEGVKQDGDVVGNGGKEEEEMDEEEDQGVSHTAAEGWDFSGDEWAVIQEERRKQWEQSQVPHPDPQTLNPM
jgi:hypothetical protein